MSALRKYETPQQRAAAMYVCDRLPISDAPLVLDMLGLLHLDQPPALGDPMHGVGSSASDVSDHWSF